MTTKEMFFETIWRSLMILGTTLGPPSMILQSLDKIIETNVDLN